MTEQFMFKQLFIIAILGLSGMTWGGPEPLDCQSSPQGKEELGQLAQLADGIGCPNNQKLDQLCSAIINKREEHDSPIPTIKHRYQSIILNASCADRSKDTPEEIQRKVQAFWDKYGKQLSCDAFIVNNGNILKLGVFKLFDDFVMDLTRRWKVDFNYIDPADNLTLLDFIQSEIERYKGSPREAVLKRYYKQFQEAGAKHRSEL
jgi:hypothetical protein